MHLGKFDETERNKEVQTPKNIEKNVPTNEDKRKLQKPVKPDTKKGYEMNSNRTIDRMRDRMPDDSKGYFDSALKSGSNPKVKLIPKGEQFYRTGKNSQGNFLTKEHPGKTPQERKENLQLTLGNDAKDVDKVLSTRPQVGIKSKINPQPEWAKEAGYKARPGMNQIFTPNTNKEGAIKDGRYSVIDNKNK